jgi:hypothetical protein
MAVLLSVFDFKMGPIPLIVIPPSFDRDIISDNTLIMNIQLPRDEFVSKDFPRIGMKSINLQCSLVSGFARGGKEELQITAFISDAIQPDTKIRAKMIECKERITSDPEMYLAVYKKHKLEGVSIDKINRKYDELVQIMKWLDAAIKIDVQSTAGCVLPLDIAITSFMLPPHLRREITRSSSAENASHVLIVFRKDDNGVSMKMLPCAKNVIKTRVIAENFTPKTLIQLRSAISLPLLFTTGLCQETTGRCLNESYFSASARADDDSRAISSALSALKFVKDFAVEIISPDRS